MGPPSLEGGRSPLPEGIGWLAKSLALICLALYLLGTGYLAAEAAWKLLPCRMPASPLSQLRCADQELARGRDREAAAALDRARRLERPDTPAELRARVLVAQGLLPKAPDRALLEQAVAVSSNTVHRLALSLQDGGRLPHAAALFDVLVARDPARRAQALVMRGTGRVLAGDKKGALKDLTEAVAWAVNRGLADPKKIGIYGGSYGGYAVLAGLTFTPDVYACGVDLVGPSNLRTLFQAIPPYWEPFKREFVLRVGDVEADDALNRALSPLYHAAKIRAPLLVGQGANDPRVNIAEAEQIVEAMRKNKLAVQYVVYADEGHGFARPDNRLDFYGRVEEFLAKHLGGRVEARHDIPGSSAQVR